MLDLSYLPDDVRARTRVLVDHPPRGGYVLYWMRVAVRDHENPALDAAIAAANALGVTAFVYHAVSERYPFASDRHHTFILEGARDVAAGLRRRRVAYALHVERPGARGAFLRMLAENAALVVTEAAPFPPLAEWTQRLAKHVSARQVPFVTVDASCVVPMPLLKRRFERAYAFRSASQLTASAALTRPWTDVAPARSGELPDLPFTPVEAESLDDRAIARLVAACAIDHSVGPVRTVRGGSQAGYARWEAFRASGLSTYAQRRNDAAVDGTSRLSPWLHYGHVSPLRIARDAGALPRSASVDKFLDELLVWREAAWHFASHTPNLDSLEVLPAWALSTLQAHSGDARDVLSTERLERGRTGDRLWDLAQRSLVVQGELHNNVRMTWGKALPAWTRSPEDARRALVSLNNRYALDGRDPSSYGGLYWCLGLFDRPFSPEQPVLGSVRPRPTAPHARRLDLDGYTARVSRPARFVGRVAVVGAGVAGLACARTLLDHGVDVTLFDKGRAPGGRLATPRSTDVDADLGAQYFTARDERFARFVRSWHEDGVVERWDGRIRARPAGGGALVDTAPLERWVGTPNMSAIARHLGGDVGVRASHRVDEVVRSGPRFALAGTVAAPGVALPPRHAASDEPVPFGEFDVLIVCMPPQQAHGLVRASGGCVLVRHRSGRARPGPSSRRPPRPMNARDLPEKTCASCGRRITWRKKWARAWSSVRYCSDRCRVRRVDGSDTALEVAIRELLSERSRDASIGPSEAARREVAHICSANLTNLLSTEMGGVKPPFAFRSRVNVPALAATECLSRATLRASRSHEQRKRRSNHALT